MKVKFTYPVIVFHSIEKDITEDEYEKLYHSSLEEQARFIDRLNEEHQTGELTEPKLIRDALDTQYATIKPI